MVEPIFVLRNSIELKLRQPPAGNRISVASSATVEKWSSW